MTYEVDAKRGVANHYGVRTTDGSKGAAAPSTGIIKRAQWDFSYDNLPAAGTNNLQFVIPANATVVSAKLYVDVAFTSTSTTTDLVVGLYTGAGVAIDADGLVSASEATQTAIGTAGNVVTGAGALVGKTIGASAGEVVVAPTVDDLLTGKARLVVEYVYDKN
jgi:hypothetical protein